MITSINRLTMRQARMMRGFSQEKVAKLMKIHVNTYRFIEKHPEKCTIGQGVVFSKLVELNLDEIFFSCNSTLSRDESIGGKANE